MEGIKYCVEDPNSKCLPLQTQHINTVYVYNNYSPSGENTSDKTRLK